MNRLKVEIDVGAVTAVLQGLSPSAMQAAWRRTLRKTAAWIKSQTAKEVSAATRIPQKTIRRRLYFFLRSADTGKVWLGLNPIEAHRRLGGEDAQGHARRPHVVRGRMAAVETATGRADLRARREGTAAVPCRDGQLARDGRAGVSPRGEGLRGTALDDPEAGSELRTTKGNGTCSITSNCCTTRS